MFTTHPCQAFLDHWSACRTAGCRVAARSRLDPVDMPRLLPQMIVYDVGDTAEDVAFRLVGTGITRRWGFDPTGRACARVLGGEDGRDFAAAILRAARDSAGLRMVRRHERASGAVDEIEVCALPVWHEVRGVAQVMSVSAPVRLDRRHTDAANDPIRRRAPVAQSFFSLDPKPDAAALA
ncbi:PAS domain-containing protein [Limimonas halophila]|nr:PAS domain-containing protein [Limimonas halophila]